jgi:hypothetical protein
LVDAGGGSVAGRFAGRALRPGVVEQLRSRSQYFFPRLGVGTPQRLQFSRDCRYPFIERGHALLAIFFGSRSRTL